MTTARSKTLPVPVRRALLKLGQDIGDARKRRRIPVLVLAERASISKTTLNKIERGDSGVSMGNYATVLFSLGLIENVSALADIRGDKVGLALEEDELPKRVRLAKPRKAEKPHG